MIQSLRSASHLWGSEIATGLLNENTHGASRCLNKTALSQSNKFIFSHEYTKEFITTVHIQPVMLLGDIYVKYFQTS